MRGSPRFTQVRCLLSETPRSHSIQDDNHKPEMAIALTDFRGLCGFLPIPDIKAYLRNVPELRALVSDQVADRFLSAEGPEEREQLQNLFSALMQADPNAVNVQLSHLVARYNAENERSDVKDLVLSLNEQYPGDVGVFCPFMLNYVRLETGQAIFLGAGEPHAYISGGRASLRNPAGVSVHHVDQISWNAWPTQTMSSEQVSLRNRRTSLIFSLV